MNRNNICRAVILKNNHIGEIHKGVVMLTDSMGLVSAVAHGAYSRTGKLRGITNPLCYGTCYLYSDPVRKSMKITDFDVQDFFTGVKERIEPYYAAMLCSEVILKSHGGGEEGETVLQLFIELLGSLNEAKAEHAALAAVVFLWRYLDVLGSRPELALCGNCGREIARAETRFYSSVHADIFCTECHGEHMPQVVPGSAGYLRYIAAMPITEAVEVPVTDPTFRNLKRLLFSMVEDVLEAPLLTLRSSGGIL